MKLSDLKSLPVFQTATLASVCRDPDTYSYLQSCIHRFYSGDYGMVGDGDAELNNADLAAGTGHVIGRYEAKHKLTDDIYIESHFCEDSPGIDFNYTMVSYTWER